VCINFLLFILIYKIFQVFQQNNQILNQAGMILSEKLSINQSLYIKFDSIAYSYQKSYVKNIKSISIGNEQVKVPNLCFAIKSMNCSNAILTSQV